MSAAAGMGGSREIESRPAVLRATLERFFADPDRLARLREHLAPNPPVSLRVLDWLVTNYSKRHNVTYATADGAAFNMHVVYKYQLKGYSKRLFDPFGRKERLDFKGTSTTIGQLNFFRWALLNGVLDYARQHSRDIDADMMAALRDRLASDDGSHKKTKKRRELSRSAVKTCTRTPLTTTMRFE